MGKAVYRLISLSAHDSICENTQVFTCKSLPAQSMTETDSKLIQSDLRAGMDWVNSIFFLEFANVCAEVDNAKQYHLDEVDRGNRKMLKLISARRLCKSALDNSPQREFRKHFLSTFNFLHALVSRYRC